jgi:hypothetical protein
MVHGLEVLSETERAQDEFFHLFEALKRRGARVLLAADRPPSRIGDIDERLRSRFEGGLVLEVEEGAGIEEIVLVDPPEDPPPDSTVGPWDGAAGPLVPEAGVGSDPTSGDEAGGGGDHSAPGSAGGGESAPATPSGGPSPSEDVVWVPSREKVVLHWPELDRLIIEELD